MPLLTTCVPRPPSRKTLAPKYLRHCNSFLTSLFSPLTSLLFLSSHFSPISLILTTHFSSLFSLSVFSLLFSLLFSNLSSLTSSLLYSILSSPLPLYSIYLSISVYLDSLVPFTLSPLSHTLSLLLTLPYLLLTFPSQAHGAKEWIP